MIGMKSFYLVGYDIVSDKRRSKVASIMESFGYRVQYSLFECRLDRRGFGSMVKQLAPYVDKGQGDSIRIYRLCEACVSKAMYYGACPDPWERPEIII